MSFEIHMYMAVALATEACGALCGERHPMLVFLRQTAAEHDLTGAEAVVLEAGWSEVDITRAGTLPVDAPEQMDALFRSHYETALRDGWSLLVYDTVVQPAPEAKD